MRISDWSSDVCSSDLVPRAARWPHQAAAQERFAPPSHRPAGASKAKLNHCSPWWSLSFLGRTDTAMDDLLNDFLAETAEILAEAGGAIVAWEADRSEEHTSELQSLMRISYAVFCLKKKKQTR